MYSRIMTASLMGLDCEKVWAEADVENGLSSFNIVGLANQSIRESKDRVRSAIENCGYEFPDTRITVNLTPAGIKKEGSHFDLAIALGILLSSSDMRPELNLDEVAFLGELTLDGKINKVNGLLPMVIGLRNLGIKRFVIPKQNLDEASLVRDIGILPVEHLLEVIDLLCGMSSASFVKASTLSYPKQKSEELDFSDIKGQEMLKRAALIAAAGFHGMLIIGPPGVGKSMIGKRIPGIMPELTYDQQLEVTQVYSIAGLLSEERPIITERPFRSPHHGASPTAMIGGGRYPLPGEVTLAHRGVLFLDELPEFQPKLIETLRQPMEDGKVSIARAEGKCIYPAKFMLVAAMNPCKCGYYGDPVKRCTCTETDRQRYMARVSGPLLDRIDLHIVAQRPSYSEMNSTDKSARIIDTLTLKKQVERACSIQKERYKNLNIDFNSSLSPAQINKFCKLDASCQKIMQDAFAKWNMSARAYHKVLKLARTIADLDACENIKETHLLEAFSYRMPDQFFFKN